MVQVKEKAYQACTGAVNTYQLYSTVTFNKSVDGNFLLRVALNTGFAVNMSIRVDIGGAVVYESAWIPAATLPVIVNMVATVPITAGTLVQIYHRRDNAAIACGSVMNIANDNGGLWFDRKANDVTATIV